jgi:hypothetical protein
MLEVREPALALKQLDLAVERIDCVAEQGASAATPPAATKLSGSWPSGSVATLTRSL